MRMITYKDELGNNIPVSPDTPNSLQRLAKPETMGDRTGQNAFLLDSELVVSRATWDKVVGALAKAESIMERYCGCADGCTCGDGWNHIERFEMEPVREALTLANQVKETK